MTACPNVIFIGSFIDETKDGSVGGQMFACKSIINSKVSDHVNFLLIDSTVDSVPVPPLYSRFYKVFNRFFLLFRYLLTSKVDKVLIFSSTGPSFLEKGLVAVICKLFFKKIIFAPRSGLLKNRVKSSFLFRSYVKLVFNISDKVICQSTGWKDFYKDACGHDDDKFAVILNWINQHEYHDNNPVYHNKDGHAKVLLYLGWLEEYKGIFDLIEAIRLIREKTGDLKVHVYGSGKAEKKAVSLCHKYGLEEIIIFKGRANKAQRLEALANADIYVLPSHTEGFPNALLEAMASGIPSIACNVGGVSEIVIPGETGLLVEPRDVESLSNAIYELHTNKDLRAKFSENSKNIIATKNSLEIAEAKFLELLLQ
jgi:glycosyltransferase involved in cell wall biosynthesis